MTRRPLVSLCLVLVLSLVPTVTAQTTSGQTASELQQDFSSELPRIDPLAPAEAHQAFELHSDLEIQLVAGEPLVRDPVAIDFDELGRMYVVQMQGYSEDGEARLGSVQLLTDTNGDGNYDRSQAFVQDLSWPTSVCCFDGGVFIAAAPDILYCRDTNEDGVADERKVVYTGFGRENVQGLLNNLQWGVDNNIHAATSRNRAEVRQPDQPADQAINLRGRDFAWDPWTGQLWAETGGGQHGMTFDAWGNKFFCSNSDHIRMVLYEDRYLARNPLLASADATLSIAEDGPAAEVFRASPVEPWRIVRTRLRVAGLVPGPIEGGGRAAGYFTGASGVLIYTGDALPERFRGRAFVGDVGGNLVHQKQIEWTGSRAVARRMDDQTEFLRSRDIWFRPVQMANGPDGALYVIDMYREVIEHPLGLPPMIKRHLDLTSGRDRGRIWRVTTKDNSAGTRALPGQVAPAQQVRMLAHPNGWHRLTAARLLTQQGPQVATPVRRLLQTSSSPEGRLQALSVLAKIGALEQADVETALKDPSPEVRRHAVRLSESFSIRLLQHVWDDANPGVRQQLAFSAGEFAAEATVPALVRLAVGGRVDEAMRTAILTSAHSSQPQLLEALLVSADPQKLTELEPLLVELASQAARRAGKANWGGVAQAMDRRTVQLPQLVDRLLLAVLQAAGPDREMLEEHFRRAEVGRLAERLDGLLDRVLAQATDQDLPTDQRVRSARGLQVLDEQAFEQVFGRLLDPTQPPEVQAAILEVAAGRPVPTLAHTMADRMGSLTPPMRRRALQAMAGRPAWVHVLLGRLEDQQVPLGWLDAPLRQQLLQHPDETIRQRARSVLGEDGRRVARSVEGQVQQVLEMRGDAGRGRALFEQHCAACHGASASSPVGPAWDVIRSRGAAAVLANVLDPNAERDPRYEGYHVATVDGRVLSGIIAAESAASITLVLADGTRQALARHDIDQLTASGKSLMPEGFERLMDQQQLADLVAFIVDEASAQNEGN